MGSLPNISELCREKAQRRTADKELDLARIRARQIEFNRTDGRDNAKDGLPTLFQVSSANQCSLECAERPQGVFFIVSFYE